MRPSEVTKRLSALIAHRLPVLLTGAPGVGKTDLSGQAVTAQPVETDFVVTHPVVSDPTDYKGLPGVVDGKAEFLPFGDLRLLLEAQRPTVCLLDDLGQAPAVVQAAVMQLLLSRRINGHRLPECVTFIACTNRRQDRAGVTGILEPVKSRFATIIEVEPELDDWTTWAMNNGVAGEVVAYLRFRPENLHNFKPTADLVNSPCPRTWAYVSKLLGIGLADFYTLSGAIGEGAAREFVEFLKIYRSLPSIDGIIMNPSTEPVPGEISAQWAVATALLMRLTLQNAGNIITYGSRLPKEHSAFLVVSAHKKFPAITALPEFTKWTVAHRDVL